MSLSCVAVAALPLIHARLLPCTSIVRRSNSVSLAPKPACSSHSSKTGALSNSALISQRCAPSRTTPASARAPSASCSASIKMDLPAPVSPVSTVKPSHRSRSRACTMTKSRRDMLLRLIAHAPGGDSCNAFVPMELFTQRIKVAPALGMKKTHLVLGPPYRDPVTMQQRG